MELLLAENQKMKEKIKDNDLKMMDYNTKVTYLNLLEGKYKSLQAKLEKLKQLDEMMEAAAPAAQELAKTTDHKSLCTMLINLKHELRRENKNTKELQNSWKLTQQDLRQEKKKNR